MRTGRVVSGATAGGLGALWTSADRGSTWIRRANPCRAKDGGGALVAAARDNPSRLLLDCYDGEQSSQEELTQHHVYASSDSGISWVRRADPAHTGGPVTLVDAGGGQAFLAVTGGVRELVSATFDGGRHWRPVVGNREGDFGPGDLQFPDSSSGFVLAPTHDAPQQLYRTTDGGAHWSRIPVPSLAR